jgi:YD repeat-containing protein
MVGLLAATRLLAQSAPTTEPLPTSFLPKSPTVAPFQRFDKQALVNLKTGAAQLSVPLVELQSGPLQTALALNYSFTGLRVVQPLDLVGLGWSLQAGGSISRRVVGRLDEQYAPYNADSVGINSGNYFFIRRSYRGDVDTSPDFYDFAVGPYQGRFTLRDTTVTLFPQQPVQIRWLRGRTGFVLAAETGVRYIFGTSESTVPHSANFGNLGEYVSSWHVTQIIAAGGTDTLRFHYSRHNYTESKRPGQTSLDVLAFINGVPYNYLDQPPRTAMVRGSTIRAQVLDSITTRNARVLIQRNQDGIVQQVIKISTLQGRRYAVRTFALTHSYFTGLVNGLPQQRRLRLDGVQEGNGRLRLPAYQFSYDTTVALPPVSSTGQDHWGYYNGQNSNGLTSSGTIGNTQSALLPHPLLGALSPKREADGMYTQAGGLVRVTYPTGGTTSFTYESNRWPLTDELGNFLPPPPDTLAIHLEAFSTNSAHPDGNRLTPQVFQSLGTIHGDSAHFTLTATTKVKFAIEAIPVDPTYYTDKRWDFLLLKQVAAGDTVLLNRKAPNQVVRLEQVLPPGHYVVWALCQSQNDAGGSADEEQFVTVRVKIPRLTMIDSIAPGIAEMLGNGLRVKETVTMAPGSPALVKSYGYTLNSPQGSYSSGKNLLPGQAQGVVTYHATPFSSIPEKPWEPSPFYWRTTSDITAFGDEYKKYTFYYTCITEQLGGEGAGKTAYYHRHWPEQFNDVLPIQERVYQADPQQPARFTLLRRQQYQYAVDTTRAPVLPAFRAYNTASFKGPVIHEEKAYSAETYQVMAYHLWPEWTQVVQYTPTGDSSSTRTRTVQQQQRVVRTTTWDAAGEHNSAVTYLSDYVSSLPNYTQLRSYNFNPILEVQRWLRFPRQTDSLLVGSDLTLYDARWQRPASTWHLELAQPTHGFNASPMLGKQYGAFVRDTRYRRRATMQYDPITGDPLSEQPTAGVATSYIWGYNHTELVAQVQNAQPTQVAYTSFEAGSLGRWQGLTRYIGNLGYTGEAGYDLQGGLACYNLPAGQYQLSCRRQGIGGSLVANGQTLQPTGPAVKGWVEYATILTLGTTGTVQLSGSGQLDEVRLYPVGARLTSYTYAPLVGMTSQTDPDGRTTTYEYDGLGRLVRTRDEQGRILGQQQYHYAGQ